METTQSFIGNVANLNAQLVKESWFNTFWAKFSGFVDISKDDNGNNLYKPSGKPIEILNECAKAGRDNILIPFLSALSGDRVHGDTVLKGTGEDMSMKWLRSYVNQWRKAVMKKSGNMSEIRAKIYKLYDEAKPLLIDYIAKQENQDCYQAYYEGVSEGLSKGTNEDGQGLYKRLHPNFWHNDTGVWEIIAGTEGQTPTAAEMDTAVTACDVKWTGAYLWSARTLMMKKRIPQMTTKNGVRYWNIIFQPITLQNLIADTTYYKTALQAAYTGTKDMPEMQGIAGFYAGFAIYEDVVGVRGWDAAAGPWFYGATNATRFEPATVTDNTCAVVFGANSMGKAIGRDWHFTDEIDDHRNTIEIGAAVTHGYNRPDFTLTATADETTGDLFRKGSAAGGVAAIASGIAATNQTSFILMSDTVG